MQKSFPGHYRAEISAVDLTSNATLISFDANVLLNLYRFPSEAATNLLEIMESVAQRVWIPYQAALEYQRNRLTVIADQNRRYRDVRKIAESIVTSLESELSKLQLQKRHSTINPRSLIDSIRNSVIEFCRTLSAQEAHHHDVTDDDPIRERLDNLFADRIGKAAPDQEWITNIEKQGTKRYALQIPPGYKDQSKDGEIFIDRGLQYSRPYGDLILWNQLIEHSKEHSINQIVFVTDDDKDDWWQFVDSGGSKRIGPRPELVDEITRETNVQSFIMLTSDRFAQRFSELAGVKLRSTTVAEVRDVKSAMSERVAVSCPNCGTAGFESLGEAQGSSAVHDCESCRERFHVHRGVDGEVFTKRWGKKLATPVINRVQVNCPTCDELVPANIREGATSADRYCMNCCTLLRIGADGLVISSEPSNAISAESQTTDGPFTYLTCPNCDGHPATRTIWSNREIVRGVCRGCGSLLEARLDSSS